MTDVNSHDDTRRVDVDVAFRAWLREQRLSPFGSASLRRAFIAGFDARRDARDDGDVAREAARLAAYLTAHGFEVIAETFACDDGVGELSGRSLKTIRRWASAHVGPRFTTIGRRRVYDLVDVVRWMRSRTFEDIGDSKRVLR